MATVAIQRRHSRTGMTQGASRGEVRANQRESGHGVIKDRSKPIDSRMARRASGWVGQSHVVRDARIDGCVCRVLILRGVAAVASGWQRPAVIVTHMAQRAGGGQVRPGQRESGGGVIERGSRPIRRRVA